MAHGSASQPSPTEPQWNAFQPHLPANPRRGHPYADHRQVLNGILWRIKVGAPWRDIPDRYGLWRTCHDRLARWERDGTWLRLLTSATAPIFAAVGNVPAMTAAPPRLYITAALFAIIGGLLV